MDSGDASNRYPVADEPQALFQIQAANPDIPVIDVGSVSRSGTRSSFSQGSKNGPYLTVSAVGENVIYANSEGEWTYPKGLSRGQSGTSFGTSLAQPLCSLDIAES
jgi:hypothetical protein